MYLTHVRHRVKDYAQWRKAFDDNAPMLHQAGVLDTRIVQVNGDPNDVVVINTWPARKNWDEFIALHHFQGDDAIREAQEKGGVIGEPEWYGGEIR